MIPVVKPIKPKKKILLKESATYDFNWVSHKVSLLTFLEWVHSVIPEGVIDPTIELVEDWNYDNCTTWIEIAWERLGRNPNYDKEIKKYERQMKKWVK